MLKSDICLQTYKYLNGCAAPTDRLDLCVISRRIHQQIGFTSSFHRYSSFHIWQSRNAKKKSLRFSHLRSVQDFQRFWPSIPAYWMAKRDQLLIGQRRVFLAAKNNKNSLNWKVSFWMQRFITKFSDFYKVS